ncbi:AT-hook motif nuclear-localized protein 14-like [Cynara cardunculus var. scolymus]|uniref:AT-hook motif nuclear-localized protein n=1 Tax=Cynara cardunculus var. scolymus TaxID=59895 RepID=A0A103Y970_CYNCS|nr:AT-hook motif nuclear-localized protein 14-like [Cynara cardunculus var. scolymus]KVI04795.1 protein of unknown function DUF296 [Cynara cardunculus var. scolymus]
MEPGDPGVGSYYHHQQPPPPQRYSHHQQPPSQPPAATTNAILPNTITDTGPPQMLYPRNSVPSAVSSPTGVRRKRGRPRKYSTPEQAAAAKRLSSLSSPSAIVPPLSSSSKNDVSNAVGASSSSSKKSSAGNAGQGFTPYIITVTAGEDINHTIMSFMQQSKQEICIISASGVISNATLRQPATSGGNITYEGRFDILSLCGSFVRSDFRSSSSGGLSICLSSNDGQIIGGGVDGPLIAAGPVQVILGAFVISGKNAAMFTKDDASVGPSSLGFPSAPESFARTSMVGNDGNHQNSHGYPFMIPNGGMPVTTDWRNNNDSRSAPGFNFSGRLNHGANHSPKNGDYDRFQG